MSTGRRGVGDRWAAIAGPGSVGASYLPCCLARLLSRASRATDLDAARAALALLWSDRASALRFRRSVLAMTVKSQEQRLELARLQREAFAYDTAAARLRSVPASRLAWLVRSLRARSADRLVGATLSTMSAELSVLLLASASPCNRGAVGGHG